MQSGMALGKLEMVDQMMEKYELPEWVKPYVYRYIRQHPIGAIKHAVSFIDVKRKKGEITNKHVKLPNGMTFRMEDIKHLLTLFHYAEERMASIAKGWVLKSGHSANPDYIRFFTEMAESDTKHMRAIKNLMEGLGSKPGEPTPEVKAVFDYLETIDDWQERLVATNLILRGAYSRSFGLVFYKVFYHVSPEFMRSFGKAFSVHDDEPGWGDHEAERLIRDGKISSDRLSRLSQALLSRTCRSIDAEMRVAANAGIKTEMELLRDISIAYPLHSIQEMGAPIDIDEEIKNIKRISKS
ncbi:MAG: ferritin-like domain-containing protein [Candidatus Micrarchaeota archaeon]|nr:ferritin-like domain-containing protein [Candidatus Micrarchaeota archaeon]